MRVMGHGYRIASDSSQFPIKKWSISLIGSGQTPVAMPLIGELIGPLMNSLTGYFEPVRVIHCSMVSAGFRAFSGESATVPGCRHRLLRIARHRLLDGFLEASDYWWLPQVVGF